MTATNAVMAENSSKTPAMTAQRLIEEQTAATTKAVARECVVLSPNKKERTSPVGSQANLIRAGRTAGWWHHDHELRVK